MKRVISLLLSMLLLLSMVGCGQTEPAETTLAPEPTQSEAEANVLKILIIGNSHSNDAFWQLYEVFKAQAPEQEVVLGILYYSGCPIRKHVAFANSGEKVYVYYKNDSGYWQDFADVDMQTALRDQAWDIIMFQPNAERSEYEKDLRDQLAAFVAKHVHEPYDLYLHKSWVSPNDESLFAADHDPQPPAGFKESLVQKYGFDPVNHSKVMIQNVTELILDDEMFTKFIGTNAAILHAHYVSGVPQTELWRDYTHLTDYGRLLAAYTLYSAIMEEEITEVKVSSISANLRHRRAQVLGDMEVTEEMKQVILAAANYAVENPWTVPGQE